MEEIGMCYCCDELSSVLRLAVIAFSMGVCIKYIVYCIAAGVV